jgi:hypothetical protein
MDTSNMNHQNNTLDIFQRTNSNKSLQKTASIRLN